MIPNSLLGLLLFLAGIGPGYVYVLVAERREPRVERSPFLEAASLFVVGGLTTGVAAVLVLILLEAAGWLDFERLIETPAKYLAREPFPILSALLLALALGYLLAWSLALLVYRGKEPTLRPHLSVWWQTIGEAKKSGAVFATVELIDGRIIDGYVYTYTLAEVDVAQRDLCLQRPIFARPSARVERALLDIDYLVLPGRDIAYLSLKEER